MSSLADDIRAQARVARTVGTSLSTTASNTRTKITTMQWKSTSADFCRQKLTEFTRIMDQRSADAHALAITIDKHAASVESRVDTLETIVGLPGRAVDAVTGPPTYSRPIPTEAIRGGAAR